MTTGGAHLECGAPHVLTPHVGEVEPPATMGKSRRLGDRGPGHVTSQVLQQVTQLRCGTHPVASHQGGLVTAVGGDHHGGGLDGLDQRDDARDAPDRAIEAQFAQQGHAVDRLGVELAGRHQERHGDGKVEPGPTLAGARGGEVDRDSTERPLPTTGEQGGPHTVAGFPACSIGQPDHGEAGKARRDVYLDQHRAAIDAEQGGRRNGGEQRNSSERRLSERATGAGHSSACARLVRDYDTGCPPRGLGPSPEAAPGPPGDDTGGMGFNPYRPQRRRRSDFVFVVAAFVVTFVLLAWAVR